MARAPFAWRMHGPVPFGKRRLARNRESGRAVALLLDTARGSGAFPARPAPWTKRSVMRAGRRRNGPRVKQNPGNISQGTNGAGGEDRTPDLRFTKPLHYRCATPAHRATSRGAGSPARDARALIVGYQYLACEARLPAAPAVDSQNACPSGRMRPPGLFRRRIRRHHRGQI